MHCFSFDVGFTNIVDRSVGQSGVETKYGVPTVQDHARYIVIGPQINNNI